MNGGVMPEWLANNPWIFVVIVTIIMSGFGIMFGCFMEVDF